MRILWVGLLLALSACGFHLRSTETLPLWFNKVAIHAEGYYSLASLIKSQFSQQHIETVDNPAQAQYILFISKEVTAQQITSIGASTNPRQYQLTYLMQFKLLSRRGKAVLEADTIVLNRQLTVNSDKILGSNFEENLLYNEMRREAVQQLISRIHSAKL